MPPASHALLEEDLHAAAAEAALPLPAPPAQPAALQQQPAILKRTDSLKGKSQQRLAEAACDARRSSAGLASAPTHLPRLCRRSPSQATWALSRVHPLWMLLLRKFCASCPPPPTFLKSIQRSK